MPAAQTCLQKFKRPARIRISTSSLPLDMLAEDSFAPAFQTVLDRFGRVDILVNCAGISQRGTAIETELQVDRRLMELNYFGPVALTKLVLPSMLARRDGQIVVISSLMGKFALPARGAYSASKHALHGFFDALRAEVEDQGVAVTIVCPGYVRTNASFNALEGDGQPHNQWDKEIAGGMAPEECARQIVRAIERRRREVYVCSKERDRIVHAPIRPRPVPPVPTLDEAQMSNAIKYVAAPTHVREVIVARHGRPAVLEEPLDKLRPYAR